jgi:hypothetical protein
MNMVKEYCNWNLAHYEVSLIHICFIYIWTNGTSATGGCENSNE